MPEIERALEINPGNVEAWLVKGVLLRNTKRPGGGDAYRHAYELDPSNADAITALSSVEFQAGRFDERYRLALRARDLDPMLLFRHISAAIGAGSLGRRDELRAIITHMRELFPNDAGAETIYCTVLTEALAEHDEGAACALAAIAELEDRPAVSIELYRIAAHAFKNAGDDALALQYYERAAQAGDTEATIQSILLRHDEPALHRQAREILERGVSVNDWDIIDLLTDGGLHQEALELYRRAGIADLVDHGVSDASMGALGLDPDDRAIAVRGRAGRSRAAAVAASGVSRPHPRARWAISALASFQCRNRCTRRASGGCAR
jgi:tetratricopeptide (TPR) repeat protein